jgi:hypothetical protein
LAKPPGNNIEPRIPDAVPPAHARALSAHFKTVEEYLRVVESSLGGLDGVFCASPAEVPEAERVRIHALSAEIINGLGRIKRELGLQPLENSSLGVIRAYLSELWVSLVETRGRHLRGYGEVPDDLAAYLDRRVGELDSRVSEIRNIVEDVARRRAGKSEATLMDRGEEDAAR